MKAVVTTRPRPVEDPRALVDVERPVPVAAGRDLLVRVEAVSVNPVDTKVRAKVANEAGIVLGWDAAGVVEAVGSDVQDFRPGDEVFYAGDITRSGSNAEFQLVDERIVGRKPATLSFAEAAAFPLVTITAWEALFERLGIPPRGNEGRSLLIIGGAGGVGSIAIQLAHAAGLTVIVTASRPETQRWVRKLGAHHVVDHRWPLAPQLTKAGFPEVDFIANFSNTDAYWIVMAEVIRPQGRIVAIVETTAPLDLNLLKAKSASFAWEFMFTRAQFQTPDMTEQGRLLTALAGRIDAGEIRSIVGETLSGINAANLRRAHARAESGTLVGKLVLAGWSP